MQLQGAKSNAWQGLASSETVLHADSLAILCAMNNRHTSNLTACFVRHKLPAALTEGARSASRAVCDSAVAVRGWAHDMSAHVWGVSSPWSTLLRALVCTACP